MDENGGRKILYILVSHAKERRSHMSSFKGVHSSENGEISYFTIIRLARFVLVLLGRISMKIRTYTLLC